MYNMALQRSHFWSIKKTSQKTNLRVSRNLALVLESDFWNFRKSTWLLSCLPSHFLQNAKWNRPSPSDLRLIRNSDYGMPLQKNPTIKKSKLRLRPVWQLWMIAVAFWQEPSSEPQRRPDFFLMTILGWLSKSGDWVQVGTNMNTWPNLDGVLNNYMFSLDSWSQGARSSDLWFSICDMQYFQFCILIWICRRPSWRQYRPRPAFFLGVESSWISCRPKWSTIDSESDSGRLRLDV